MGLKKEKMIRPKEDEKRFLKAEEEEKWLFLKTKHFAQRQNWVQKFWIREL